MPNNNKKTLKLIKLIERLIIILITNLLITFIINYNNTKLAFIALKELFFWIDLSQGYNPLFGCIIIA